MCYKHRDAWASRLKEEEEEAVAQGGLEVDKDVSCDETRPRLQWPTGLRSDAVAGRWTCCLADRTGKMAA